MKAIIINDKLEIEGLQLISGNIDTYELEVEHNWEDVTIKALFVQEKSAISVPMMDGKVIIPKLNSGKWNIGFIGYKIIENEVKTKQISTNLEPFLTIIGAGDESIITENQEVPTSTIWEQYLSTMNNVLEQGINARDITTQAKNDTVQLKADVQTLKTGVEQDISTGIDTINGILEDYNINATSKTVEFNSNYDTKKQAIDTTAQEVETARQEVATNTATVVADTQQVAEDKTSVNSTYADFLSQLGSEVATLENGKVPINQIPRIAITETKTFASIEERDLWESQEGDIAIVTSNNKSYIKDGNGDWNWLENPSDYSTNAGHSATSDFASDSEKINGKRVISMTQEAYDNAFDNGTLLEDTIYFVPKED